MIELVLGGVRSGKSRYAESRIASTSAEVVYVATAQAQDQSMTDRIAKHRATRPSNWLTAEEPYNISAVLARHNRPESTVLVECLTLWLTNLLLSESHDLTDHCDALLQQLETFTGHLILVGNESNMGVTPLGELSRKYCDEAGLLHQKIATLADRVILVVAGLPLVVKEMEN